MRGPLLFVVVCAALAGTAMARAPTRHHGAHHRHLARTAPQHQVIEMADVGASAQSPYYQTAALPAGDGHWRTSLEYQLAHGRVTGQFGYNHATSVYEIDPHEVNSAAGTQLGHPDATMGAKVSIPF